MNKTEYKVTIWEDGRQEWRNEAGELHRLDGPAVIANSHQAWWANGKYHRLDGPAIIKGDFQAWWVDGELHRLDGPAIINSQGQQWHVNGKLHRLDGPAWIDGDHQEWWIEGKKYTKDEFDSYITKMNQSTIPEVKTILIDGVVYKIERLEGQ